MPDRTLILLRHAKSDWSGGQADSARPLAKRGRRQAPEAGRWLNNNIPTIDLALVSPAERARSTWGLVTAELDVSPHSRLDARLYDGSCEDLLAVLRGLSDELGTVVMVGHNPGLEDLVLRLTGEEVALPTSAVAVVALHGPWAAAGRASAALVAAGRPPAP